MTIVHCKESKVILVEYRVIELFSENNRWFKKY